MTRLADVEADPKNPSNVPRETDTQLQAAARAIFRRLPMKTPTKLAGIMEGGTADASAAAAAAAVGAAAASGSSGVGSARSGSRKTGSYIRAAGQTRKVPP